MNRRTIQLLLFFLFLCLIWLMGLAPAMFPQTALSASGAALVKIIDSSNGTPRNFIRLFPTIH
jgi:hypothetical protein